VSGSTAPSNSTKAKAAQREKGEKGEKEFKIQ
jgi:hypothetical protein